MGRKSADSATQTKVKAKGSKQLKPVEAESEESEQEWVGLGGVNESSEGGEEDEDGEEDDGDSSEDELLHGLSSDDQDSSDEEVEVPAINISKLPTIAKDDKVVKQKLEKAKRQPVCIDLTLGSILLWTELGFRNRQKIEVWYSSVGYLTGSTKNR